MQRRAPAFEQVLIRRVLDQGVLETIIQFGRQTLHQQNVGFREPFQGGLQRGLFHSRDRPQQRIGKAPPDHRADLGHLAGRPKPVQPGRQRLLQRRRNRLDAAPDFAAFQEKPRHLLDEQRYPARTLGDAIDHVLRQSMPGGDLADHMPHLMSVERHERDCAVMRARTPGRLELGPCGGEDKERCERAALGNAFKTWIVVGSAQCKSSKASTTG